MARDGREVLSRSQIGYIDLGVGKTSRQAIMNYLGRTEQALDKRRQRGMRVRRAVVRERALGRWKVSNQSQRTRISNTRGLFSNEPQTTHELKSKRPPGTAQVVGEMVILKVQSAPRRPSSRVARRCNGDS